jgi:RNA polymerase sigma-70 factor (ECF subfamily)
MRQADRTAPDQTTAAARYFPGGDGKRGADFRSLLLAELRPLTLQASSMAPGSGLAEDLVQETIERALHHQASFAPGTSMRSWLMRIMRNLFIDHCRERTRHYNLNHDWNTDPETTSVREPVTEEPEATRPTDLLGASDLSEALNEIDARLRETFVLATFDGLSYGAIAERMGVPISTVGTRLVRARARLQTALLNRLTIHKGMWGRRSGE